MLTLRTVLSALPLLSAVLLAPLVHGQAPHQHGKASLQIAIDVTTDGTIPGAELEIRFDSPLDNLVGFEHAPRTEAQHHALRAAQVSLSDFPASLRLPEAALCQVVEHLLETPYPATTENLATDAKSSQAPQRHAHPPSKHEESAHKKKSEHAHEHHKHEPDHHAHDGHHAHTEQGAHNDLAITWRLQCAQADALDRLDVLLFARFPRLEKLDVQIAGPRGQQAATLSPQRSKLSW